MMERSLEKELLDTQTPPREDLQAALIHLAKTNRLFFNDWLIAYYVKKLVVRTPNASVLDIGTGLGDIPEYLARKFNISATGIDLKPSVTELAKEHIGSNPKVKIETKRLEDFADNQFSVGIISQMLHHLSPEEAGPIIKTALRKTTQGVIISDLIRSWFSYYLTKFGVALSGGHRFNKSDGPLSVLRSYTDPEIKQILQSAGITKYKTHNFLFRKIIVIPKQ